MTELSDLEFLQTLIDTPDKVSPGRKKQRDIRDYDHWFKLDHTIMGTCSQGENCLGIIEDGKGPGRVTAIVNNVEMCRYEFVNGLAYVDND